MHPLLWALASDWSQPRDASFSRGCAIIPSLIAPALGLQRKCGKGNGVVYAPLDDEQLIEFYTSYARGSASDDNPAKEAARMLRAVVRVGASRVSKEYEKLKDELETKLHFHDEAIASLGPRDARDKMAWLWIARLDTNLNGGYSAQFEGELEASRKLLQRVSAFVRSVRENGTGLSGLEKAGSLGSFSSPSPETGAVSLRELGDAILLRAEVASVVDAYFAAKVRACSLLSELASQSVGRRGIQAERRHLGTFAQSKHFSARTAAQVWPLRLLWAQECLLFHTLAHQALLTPG